MKKTEVDIQPPEHLEQASHNIPGFGGSVYSARKNYLRLHWPGVGSGGIGGHGGSNIPGFVSGGGGPFADGRGPFTAYVSPFFGGWGPFVGGQGHFAAFGGGGPFTGGGGPLVGIRGKGPFVGGRGPFTGNGGWGYFGSNYGPSGVLGFKFGGVPFGAGHFSTNPLNGALSVGAGLSGFGLGGSRQQNFGDFGGGNGFGGGYFGVGGYPGYRGYHGHRGGQIPGVGDSHNGRQCLCGEGDFPTYDTVLLERAKHNERMKKKAHAEMLSRRSSFQDKQR